jgi:hypothetical protein
MLIYIEFKKIIDEVDGFLNEFCRASFYTKMDKI